MKTYTIMNKGKLQKNNFESLQVFVNELNSTNSKNDKIEIIKSYATNPFITKVLHYTYNPYFKFHVSSANCKKNLDLCDMNEIHLNIFQLLDDLKDRVYTGHDAIAMVNGFVVQFPEYTELIYNILDKNLKTRTESSINKAIPGLVPEFKVALAQPYDKQAKKVNFETQDWLASRKLDGVRCLAIVDENTKCKLYSRQGNEFDTLTHVVHDIEWFCRHNEISNCVFDGEICLMDEDGNEDFQGIMKQIKRKNHIIDNPMFKIFDVIDMDEFNNQSGDVNLSDRIALMTTYYNNLLRAAESLWKGASKSLCISILQQMNVVSDSHFQQLCTIASKEGWEGLMIRKDVGYEGKRTNNLLKVKKFHDAEYVVKDLIMETHRMIDPETGLETSRDMLAAVEIEHKGNTVKVGSGWTQEQRIKYYEDPNALLGKTITVQYFEESQNLDGKYSLRFPVVKFVYENGRTV